MQTEDPNRTAMYAALGRVTEQFNLMETALISIFARLIGLPNVGPDAFVAHALFYTPTNFGAQIGLVDSLMRYRLPDKKDKRRDRWNKLQHRVQEVKRWRNTCAHCAIAIDNTRGGVLVTHTLSALFNGKPDLALTIEDLNAAYLEFRAVGVELAKFSWDFGIEGWNPLPAQHSTSSAP